jgi:hypothetical protein
LSIKNCYLSPFSPTVLKNSYTQSPLIHIAKKNQQLTPITIRIFAHHLFIKSPTTIENMAANTTGILILIRRISGKYIKGTACKYIHIHERFIMDLWAAIHSR